MRTINPLMTRTLPLVALLSGCVSDYGQIEIVERPNAIETRRYKETFDEAYYDIDRMGNLRLALRKHRSASLEGQELTQTIVVESVWRSIPGVSVMHPTQINGTVRYELAGRAISQHLIGAGSVFMFENDARNRLDGSFSNVTLVSPTPAEGDGFLQRVELSGKFSARRDPHQALRLVNDVKRSQPRLAENRENQP